MGRLPSRVRVYDVDDVVTALERVISEHTRTVQIRGEVVNLRSGRDGRMHWFRLEDPRDGHDARLDCFAFATDVADGHVLVDGSVIEATARPDFSRRDGHLIVRLHGIQQAGEGALRRMIEERRRHLAAEGLFDAALKRPLPFVPRAVGLVTAAGSAALADVLRRIEGRFPLPVIVVPAAMQGAACADEVIAALAALDADPRVDVILIVRGGGSLQDLLPFSEERVVRAIRASGTPVVAGIGHEPDTTLACLAADARAATPTAAADMVVPERSVLAEDLAALRRRLAAGTRRTAMRARRDLDLIGSRPGLVRPHDTIVRRRLDAAGALGQRLHRAARGAVDHPQRDLRGLSSRTVRGMAHARAAGGARVAVLSARLAARDPLHRLADGFALVRDARGMAIASARAAAAAGRLTLEFGDGIISARVTDEGET